MSANEAGTDAMSLLAKRLNALEAKSADQAGAKPVVLFQPSGLSDAVAAAWHATHVAPARAAASPQFPVIVVSFVPARRHQPDEVTHDIVH